MRHRSGSLRILVHFRMMDLIGDIIQGITAYSRSTGLNWQTRCVDVEELEQNLKPSLADGVLLVASRGTPELLRRVRRSGIPAVNLLHDVTPLVPSVVPDDESIGRMAASHLQDRGFRSFAFADLRPTGAGPGSAALRTRSARPTSTTRRAPHSETKPTIQP